MRRRATAERSEAALIQGRFDSATPAGDKGEWFKSRRTISCALTRNDTAQRADRGAYQAQSINETSWLARWVALSTARG